MNDDDREPPSTRQKLNETWHKFLLFELDFLI